MHVCVLYDRFYPLTLGGGERWYRDLSERLVADGHEVTYVCLRHWPASEEARIDGAEVVVLGPQVESYRADGQRKSWPPLLYGLLVLFHLLRHGRRYDAVHAMSFPYFHLLAAALVRPLHRYVLAVDWFEVWTRDYWREYSGRAGGFVGWAVQRACIAVTQRAFCFSRLHAGRLRDEGYGREIRMLAGLYNGPVELPEVRDPEPSVVYAGRHIPEKRVPLLVEAMAHVHAEAPELRCEIFGEGPRTDEVRETVARLGLQDVVTLRGFAAREELDAAITAATCLVLPSSREGFGLVVVEANAKGTPAVVVAGPDNAAVELVQEGVNGHVAPEPTPRALADAILAAHRGGRALRESTVAWFAENAARLRLRDALGAVLEAYAR